MAEGPAHEPLASGSEAYKLKVERLEGIGTSEHDAPPIRISKTKNILLGGTGSCASVRSDSRDRLVLSLHDILTPASSSHMRAPPFAVIGSHTLQRKRTGRNLIVRSASPAPSAVNPLATSLLNRQRRLQPLWARVDLDVRHPLDPLEAAFAPRGKADGVPVSPREGVCRRRVWREGSRGPRRW